MGIIIRKTIGETFLERVRSTPGEVGFQFKPTHSDMGPLGHWREVSFKNFYQECRLVSYGLMGLGVQPGERVVILSNSRYEWSLCDIAILGASAVTVPIYASSTSDDVEYIIHHSEAQVIILEDGVQLEKILEKRLEKGRGPSLLQKIIVMEPSAMMKLAARRPEGEGGQMILTLQALKELGKREEAKDPGRFDQNLLAIRPEDLMTICYTSGTTGVPKGVMLTHDNFTSLLEDCVHILKKYLDPQKEVILSFLPFSHIFGRVESLFVYVVGWRQAYCEKPGQLMVNLAEVRPSLLFSVPRFFEKAFNTIQVSVASESILKKNLFHWALAVGRRYYGAFSQNKTPSLKDSCEYALAKRLVFRKILQRFGGNLRFAICGGAPLSPEIGEFFQVLGLPILEGYGLTETCGAVCVNTLDEPRFGVVGRPLPEVTLKIAGDGEVLIKSRKVFQAYYKMEEETNQVIKEGWFYTGDIGRIDSDGFLQITHRKKDLIITSGGKNIAPQKIENLAKAHSLISQFVVHGDRRNYLTALMTLDRNQILRYANDHQILFSEYAELIKNPKILSLAQKVVDDMNRHLAPFETIKKFMILPNDFTVEGGVLTPSMKIRRNLIQKQFKVELDSMYEDAPSVPLDSDEDIG